MHFCIALCALFITIASGTERSGPVLNSEERLLIDLLGKYGPMGKVTRPVQNVSEAVRVSFGIALTYVDSAKMTGDTLAEVKLSTWNRYLWNDPRLSWDPSDYDGVSIIRVPIEQLWRPDIKLYNSLDLAMQEDTSTLSVAFSDGSVLWIPMAKLRVSCFIPPSSWQSSTFSCYLKFASWTYDGFKLDLDFYEGNEGVDLNDYVEISDLHLVNTTATKNVKYYPCCQEPYPDLTFSLEFSGL